MREALGWFLADERGAVMPEYGLIGAGIALVTLVGVQTLRTGLGSLQQTIQSAIQSINGAY